MFTHPGNLFETKYHPGAVKEIRSKKPLNKSGAGEQCTYDRKGKLLTEPLGAGSADRYAPAGGIFGISPAHLLNDVRPYDLAVKLDKKPLGFPTPGPHLKKYGKVRPTNNKKKCTKNPA